jgi:hypothetical protein
MFRSELHLTRAHNCCENDKEHSELVGHHLLGCLLDAMYNPYIPVSYQ